MSKRTKIAAICVLTAVFCFFMWFLADDIYFGDDIFSLSSCLYGGGKFNYDSLITAFLPNVFGKYLPILFHTNPHTFSMTVGAAVRSFDVVLLCFLLPFCMYIGRKKDGFFPVIVVFSALYFCYASANMEYNCFNCMEIPTYQLRGSFMMLTEYSQHFGQLLTFVLGLFALINIVSAFVQNKIPEKKQLVPICIISYLTAVSSMYVSVVVGVSLLLTVVYYLIAESKNENYKKNLSVLAMPLVAYVLGVSTFACYPKYLNYFTLDFSFIKFAKGFLEYAVFENSLEFAAIVILSATLFLLALNKTTYIKRLIFSVFSTLLGVAAYFFLFTKLDNYAVYILTESQVLMRLTLFALILMLLGACFRELQNEKKTKKIIAVLCSILFVAFMAVQIPFVITSVGLWKDASKETKETVYSVEKMYRFYSLLNKTALLPDSSLVKIFEVSTLLEDKNLENVEKIDSSVFVKNTPYTCAYYKTFYKNGEVVPYKFIDTKLAMRIFFEEGGMIDADELKHIDFQKLKDDKFVLNRAIEKQRT